MKPIDELNISPWPWHSRSTNVGDKTISASVCDSSWSKICTVRLNETTERDVCMLKESPNLYECLCEAVELRCSGCRYEDGRGGACTKTQGECFAQRWRSTLAEAAGEEPYNA